MPAERQVAVPRVTGLAWWLYATLMGLLLPLLLLRLWWRGRRAPAYRLHWRERLGWYRENTPVMATACIWVHAVSLGETRASLPLLLGLRRRWPHARLILTHMTPTGRAAGAAFQLDGVQQLYLPYDAAGSMARFLDHVQPNIGLLMETEVWPGLVRAAQQRNVPVLLVNARLSARSARGYARIGSLAHRTFAGLRSTGAQSAEDAERLRVLGADPVTVTGNLKFDAAVTADEAPLAARFRTLWGAGRRVLLAASTREGEENLLLDIVPALPDDVLLVLVPRHPERFDEVAALLASRAWPFVRRSALGTEGLANGVRVVLGDSLGELGAYYGSADLAFVGGSLLPLGGQNLLEACARGVAVVIGPHTFNFRDATRDAVAAGAAVQVEDLGALRDAVCHLLAAPEARLRMGQAGRDFVVRQRGATARTLALLDALL